MSHPDLYLLVDGKRLKGEGRRTQSVINPATGETLGQVPLATTSDLDRALEAAQRAWPAWRALGPQQRGRILRGKLQTKFVGAHGLAQATSRNL